MLPSSRSFIRQANRFAALACPVLHFPSDGSTLVRVAPMPSSLRRLAQKVPIRKEGYFKASILVFQDFSANLRYVVGFVDLPRPVEHVWVKIGDMHYDPTWELFGGTKCLTEYEVSQITGIKVSFKRQRSCYEDCAGCTAKNPHHK